MRYGYIALMLSLACAGCSLVRPAKDLAVKAIKVAVQDLKQTGQDLIGVVKDAALETDEK